MSTLFPVLLIRFNQRNHFRRSNDKIPLRKMLYISSNEIGVVVAFFHNNFVENKIVVVLKKLFSGSCINSNPKLSN